MSEETADPERSEANDRCSRGGTFAIFFSLVMKTDSVAYGSSLDVNDKMIVNIGIGNSLALFTARHHHVFTTVSRRRNVEFWPKTHKTRNEALSTLRASTLTGTLRKGAALHPATAGKTQKSGVAGFCSDWFYEDRAVLTS